MCGHGQAPLPRFAQNQDKRAFVISGSTHREALVVLVGKLVDNLRCLHGDLIGIRSLG